MSPEGALSNGDWRPHFWVDDDVDQAVIRYLRARGYQVTDGKIALPPDAPDSLHVQLADEQGAVIVTFNKKDFRRLVGRRAPEGGPRRYRRAGILYFTCRQTRARQRVEQLIHSLEAEFRCALGRDDSRLFLEIADDRLVIYY